MLPELAQDLHGDRALPLDDVAVVVRRDVGAAGGLGLVARGEFGGKLVAFDHAHTGADASMRLRFVGWTCLDRKISTGMPSFRPIVATASAWLPDEAATTPRAVCSRGKVSSLFAAPRSLKEPVSWRFSSFRNSRVPDVPRPTGLHQRRLADVGSDSLFGEAGIHGRCEPVVTVTRPAPIHRT